MVFIGELIKRAIQMSQISLSDSSAAEQQSKQLQQLLQRAADTAFGRYHGFRQVLEAENPISAFQQQVPIFHYEGMRDWWAQQQLYPDVTWPGRPDYFALSSGTTGKASKRIPVTDDMLQSFRAVSMAQVGSLNNFDLPAEFFQRQLLALGSSTDLQARNGHLEGEISGINASNAPDWFDFFYKPGKEIASINDWDKRIEAIAEAAPDWDIGALAGIPSWVLMMLKAIVERHQLSSIHDLWPGLQVYTTGGVAFEPYRESFEALFSKPVHYMDTYLASEGYFAFNARPQTNAMQLALSQGVFYEFIPFDAQDFDETGTLLDHPKVLTIADVEADKDYALLVSTPAGAFRYMIGDTVKFTDVARCELRISGRTKYFLNVVGSQLSEEKLNAAIQELSTQTGVTINEFAVAALKDEAGAYYHQWVLGTAVNLDAEQAARQLDAHLKTLNKNYRVARDKALSEVRVLQVDKSLIYEWLERGKKKGGQIKVPKVMAAEQMQDLLNFVKQYVPA